MNGGKKEKLAFTIHRGPRGFSQARKLLGKIKIPLYVYFQWVVFAAIALSPLTTGLAFAHNDSQPAWHLAYAPFENTEHDSEASRGDDDCYNLQLRRRNSLNKLKNPGDNDSAGAETDREKY